MLDPEEVESMIYTAIALVFVGLVSLCWPLCLTAGL